MNLTSFFLLCCAVRACSSLPGKAELFSAFQPVFHIVQQPPHPPPPSGQGSRPGLLCSAARLCPAQFRGRLSHAAGAMELCIPDKFHSVLRKRRLILTHAQGWHGRAPDLLWLLSLLLLSQCSPSDWSPCVLMAHDELPRACWVNCTCLPAFQLSNWCCGLSSILLVQVYTSFLKRSLHYSLRAVSGKSEMRSMHATCLVYLEAHSWADTVLWCLCFGSQSTSSNHREVFAALQGVGNSNEPVRKYSFILKFTLSK